MSSILTQALRTDPTGNRRPVKCKLETETATAFDAHANQYERREFLMRATVYVKFWATEADFRFAERNAIRMMQQEMYKDVLTITARMRSAVFADEPEELLTLIAELEREIGFI